MKRARTPLDAGDPLAKEERRLRLWLRVGAAFFFIEAALYVPTVFEGPAASRPFAINSVAKDVLFGLLVALAAADVRRFARLVSLVAWAHVVIIVLLALSLATGNATSTFPPPRWLANLLPISDLPEGVRFWAWLVGAALATAVLLWLYRRALRAQLGLRYLSPIEHATLAAVADAILEAPTFPPREIASKVDDYWADFRAGYKWRLRAALWLVCLYPLLRFKAPLPLLERSRRRDFVERHLLDAVANRSTLGPIRTTVQASIRFCMQMVYMGYYDDPRSYPKTGYERFSDRSDFSGHEVVRHRRLVSIGAAEVPDDRALEAEVVVVGSGAGGAMAARALVRRGHDVLVVERGSHVDPDDFVEDEVAMYSALYADGALQLSRDFSFQVLQGTCVGGSTVVNNGVSFDIPDHVLAQWNGPLGAGLDERVLKASFAEVREVLRVQRQAPNVKLNPGAERVAAGIRGLELDQPPNRWGVVDANLEECWGCGYCNIGCKYGRKLSMLDGVLPETQAWAEERRRGDPTFHGRLRVLADCAAERIEYERGGSRATGVRARLRPVDDGRPRRVDIRADAVVLAGGAIHSSRLLMDSGIGGGKVGRGLTANLGSHLTADFGDEGPPLRSFDGLQMSHYLDPAGHPGWVMETWFNPVMSQSLVMPGWLTEHEDNMARYDRMTCVGVLTGSQRTDLDPDGSPLPNGDGGGNRVLRRRTMNGSQIDFTPPPDDVERLLDGLTQATEVLFAGGAERVMPATFGLVELRPGDDVERRLREAVLDPSDISINTGHPQGGNPIHVHAEKGVVDPGGRVHGWDNLFVADASVFPGATTVNPQLTVMALAHRIGSDATW